MRVSKQVKIGEGELGDTVGQLLEKRVQQGPEFEGQGRGFRILGEHEKTLCLQRGQLVVQGAVDWGPCQIAAEKRVRKAGEQYLITNIIGKAWSWLFHDECEQEAVIIGERGFQRC